MRKIDISGERFGRLTAIHALPPRNKRTFWLWRCDCGVEKAISSVHVKSGRIVSCGCYLADALVSDAKREQLTAAAKMPRTHGLSRTPEHAVWKSMRQRCKNPNSPDYRWYGALGVKVCERWDSFENFIADMGNANGLTLDRIDPFKDYEPTNCRWATWETQHQNKRVA